MGWVVVGRLELRGPPSIAYRSLRSALDCTKWVRVLGGVVGGGTSARWEGGREGMRGYARAVERQWRGANDPRMPPQVPLTLLIQNGQGVNGMSVLVGPCQVSPGSWRQTTPQSS